MGMVAEWAARQSMWTEINHLDVEICKVGRGQYVGKEKCTTGQTLAIKVKMGQI